MYVIKRRAPVGHRHPWDRLQVPDVNAMPFEVSDAHAERVLLPQGYYIPVPPWYVKHKINGRAST